MNEVTVVSKLALAACFTAALAACATAPTKEVISTKAAPAAIGPYSQGIKFGNLPRDVLVEISAIAAR